MIGMGVPLIAQLCLAFGMAGLFWPEKFLAVFDVLMFPWPSGYRTVRANSIAAIILALLLFPEIWARPPSGFGTWALPQLSAHGSNTARRTRASLPPRTS